MYKPKIGITIGDPNGIGLEIIIKTFSEGSLLRMCTPVMFASSHLVDNYRKVTGQKEELASVSIARHPNNIKEGQFNVIQSWNDRLTLTPGEINTSTNKYVTISIIEACKAVQKGLIDGIVTAPVQKSSLIINGETYKGHTDLFRTLFKAPKAMMIMASERYRVGLLTEHVPIAEVAQYVKKEAIVDAIRSFNQYLKTNFGLLKARIALLGLNPHNGDEGLVGLEEKEHIIPAIQEAQQKNNILAFGPFSADGFFGFKHERAFDGILAMYHDQGLIPFKMQYGDKGVNFTAGLPFPRTSPDHGTAMDIVGKQIANSDSFRHAVYLLIDIIRREKDL